MKFIKLGVMLPVALLLAGCEENTVSFVGAQGQTPREMRKSVLAEWQCSLKEAVQKGKLSVIGEPLGTTEVADPPAGETQKEQQEEEDLEQQVELATFVACPLNADLFSKALGGAFDHQGADKTKLTEISKRYFYIFDTSYRQYEDSLIDARRAGVMIPNFLNTFLPILGVSGTISGTELGAGGLITKLYTDTQSGYLQGGTLLSVTIQMRKDREVTKQAITGKIEDHTQSQPYLVSELVRDLILYHEAGTIETAIRNAAENTDGNSNVED